VTGTSGTSLTRTGQPAGSLHDHQVILAAIRSGNSAEAADEMLRHLVSTTGNLVEDPETPTAP
jgi:GntR family transcriptional repressor for pyruvate dehydrogenase complex